MPHATAIDTANSATSSPLQLAFEKAAREFGVPQSILMSVAFNESRWEQHAGESSMAGGYGIMHLTQLTGAAEKSAKGDDDEAASTVGADVTSPDNNSFGDLTGESDPAMNTLDHAADLLGVSPDVLKQDEVQNIRGGAALLAQYARETVGSTPEDPAAWYGAVAKYSGSDVDVVAKSFADDVYSTIAQGVERTTQYGEHAVLSRYPMTPDKSTADSLHLRNADQTGADCPNGLSCDYVPALYKQFSKSATDYGNYDLANRPNDGLDIRYIVIHDAEGSYEGTIKTFLSKSYVSAHYVVNSSNGQITEMVRPENIPWQAGNWYFNSHSIGIEHSGYAAEGGTWYTEQMYHASARLVRYLADRYHIPLDRQHILGHEDIPGLTPSAQSGMHWDPAAYWDWGHYFDLLGASFNPSNGSKDSSVVTINVNYSQNQPAMTYGGKALAPQPSNFVYLYSAPSFDAPLLSDPALHANGAPGTLAINDWGDKAVIGQTFVQADRQGDWTAIWYGGQKAWFYNPNGKNTTPGSGLLITPKQGVGSIPIYGGAYPETSAFTAAGLPKVAQTPLQYRISAGQVYVAAPDQVSSDYYYAKLFNAPSTYHVVKGDDQFYEISFNHRVAFVKKSDVDVVSQDGELK